MVWFVAALGALCLFTAAGTVLIARHMVRLRRRAFRCKIRVRCGLLSGFTTMWPKRSTRAVWARDVLIVFHGFGSLRKRSLAVACAEGAVHALPAGDVPDLGSNPVGLVLVLNDGPILQVAAPAAKRAFLCGPYLVAEVMPNRGTQSSR